MISRGEFIKYWKNINPELTTEHGALWAMEEYYGKKSRWFVNIKPIVSSVESEFNKDYWQWCHRHCAGQIICYSTSEVNQEEWWGFSHRADVLIWLLKWT